jgi:hypothetical protein
VTFRLAHLAAAAAALALAATLPAAGPGTADTGIINEMIGGDPPPAAGPDPLAEAYPVTNEPVSAVRIITGRPLPGESCRDALFEARPLVRTRFEATADENLSMPLEGLCLIEFRNDAQDRSLEIRVGEDLSTLAISADQRLFRGLVLVPNQTTSVPIRPLPVGRIAVPVDVLWASRTAPPQVQSFTLTLGGS